MHAKISLLLVFLLCEILLPAQTDSTFIADSDFEQVLIDLGYDDKINHYVRNGNISGVTELNLDYKNISSLAGIESFINLEYLSCWGNQLTSLNLSNNKMLKELNCQENQLAQLTLSDNVELTYLICSSNQLTSLDLRQTNLTMLDCSSNQLTNLYLPQDIDSTLKDLSCDNNQLTSLDVSKNTELIFLKCQENQLTSLDLSNNKDLWHLRCYENQLIQLIFSGNFHLTELDCSNNQLTSLDLRQTNLTGLHCTFNQLTELNLPLDRDSTLRSLFCANNALTTLDLSHNTELTLLDCPNNQLTSLDVSHNTALTALICDNNLLTSIELSNNSDLMYLNCSENLLGSLNLTQNTTLTQIHCEENSLTRLDVRNGNNSIIEYLDASFNPLLLCINVDNATDANAAIPPYDFWVKDVIATYSENCTEPTYTYIPDDNFEQALIDMGYDDILDNYVLRSNISGVTELNVSSLSINDLTGIEEFISLEILDCSGNQLTSLNVTHNTVLTYLNCHTTQLTSLNLNNNKVLEELWCGQSQFTSLDVTHNIVLTALDCGYNHLTDLDVTQNTELTFLGCEDNLLTSLAIARNTALEYLSCGENLLRDLDVSPHISLTHLGCRENQLTSLDVSRNTELTYLECGSNQITELDIAQNIALTELWCNNNILTNLDVSKNTALTFLRLDGNQLTSLDVSQNIALTDLNCNSNRLSQLNITQNIALTNVDCRFNQLTSLDARNEHNSSILDLLATDNPHLLCIDVDNAEDANAGIPPYDFWVKDANATYSEDCGSISIDKSLVPGWTWFSVNMMNSDMSLGNLLTCTSEGDYIKNQTKSATYYESVGWFGTLANVGLDPFSSYKIRVENLCSLSYSGTPIDVITSSINLASGWNWIGYLPQCPLPINDALSSLITQEGDYIKNQTQSAIYYDGVGWFGTLTEMEHTDGYMLKVQAEEQLIYPRCPPEAGEVKKIAYTEVDDGKFNVDPHRFKYNGTVTTTVYVDDKRADSNDDLILAYAGDQLRGVMNGMYFEPSSSYVYPMMVYSNIAEGEAINFKYYDAESNQIYSCAESLNFKEDMIVANAYDPFELSVTSVLGQDRQIRKYGPSLEVYPNPFTDQLQIKYTLEKRLKVRIVVYDILGNIVKNIEEQTLDPGIYITEWNDEDNDEGTYIVQLITQNSSMRQKVFLIK